MVGHVRQIHHDDATIAKLLLVALSFCWGLSWTAMRVALDEVSPWSMRLIGYSIGAATLLILLKAQGRSLAIPRGKNWLHIFVAALFLVVVWRRRHLRPAHGQHLAGDHRQLLDAGVGQPDGLFRAARAHQRALGARACAVRRGPERAGLSGGGDNRSASRSACCSRWCCALGWGGGTVYMKWARIKGDLLAITFWQVMVGVVVFVVLYLVFEGGPKFEPLQWQTWGGPAVQWRARHRHCLFHLVQHHRPADARRWRRSAR